MVTIFERSRGPIGSGSSVTDVSKLFGRHVLSCGHIAFPARGCANHTTNRETLGSRTAPHRIALRILKTHLGVHQFHQTFPGPQRLITWITRIVAISDNSGAYQSLSHAIDADHFQEECFSVWNLIKVFWIRVNNTHAVYCKARATMLN